MATKTVSLQLQTTLITIGLMFMLFCIVMCVCVGGCVCVCVFKHVKFLFVYAISPMAFIYHEYGFCLNDECMLFF